MDQVLEPLYQITGAILALFYALIPNYAFAISGVTLVMLAVLTPLTWRGLRANIKMQKLLPEMKRIQADFKDDRVAMNEELMKLYKEHNTTPLGGCVPFLVQSPFFIALFGTLNGMSRVVNARPQEGVAFERWERVKAAADGTLPPGTVEVGLPKHLPEGSAIAKSLTGTADSLRHPPGEVKTFGFDLARSASDTMSEGFVTFLPYLALLVIMTVLGLLAQQQITRRNPAAAAANPQLAVINKVFPFMFGIFGWTFQAGVTLYWAFSSGLRIVQQSALFRFDPHLSASVKEAHARHAEDQGKASGTKGSAKPGKPAPPARKPGLAKPTPASDGPAAANGPGYTPPKGRPTGRQQPKKKRKGR